MRAHAAVALAALLLVATEAGAAWPPGGKFIANPQNSTGIGTVWILDLPGGDLAVVCHGKSTGNYSYTVQRVGPQGDLGAGWLGNGVPLAHHSAGDSPFGLDLAVDDSSCVWQSQFIHTVGDPELGARAMFVGLDGTRVPGASSLLMSASDDFCSALAPARGGVYACFAGRVRRLLRNGAPAPGWPAIGVAFGAQYCSVDALADGAGGVIVLTTNGPGNKVTIQRIDSTAVRNAAWPVDGVQPSDLPLADPFEANLSQDGPLPALLPSGGTYFIAAWQSYSNKDVRLQRLSLDGVRDPSWPSSALLAATSDTVVSGVSVLPDRSGGAYVTWYVRGLPRATHVRSDGSFEPGTGAAGVALVPAGASYEAPWQYISPPPYVPADVTPDGRLVFAWDELSSTNFRVRWLLPDLTTDPSEPAAGRLVTPVVGNSTMRTVHADPVGGAYLAWHSRNNSAPCCLNNPGLAYMTRILPSALLAAPRTTPGAPAIALSSSRPNPARDAISLELTLAEDVPAKLELLDVAGRVLRTQIVESAGRHSLAFTGLRDLPPGLYFVRATTKGESKRTRVVITR